MLYVQEINILGLGNNILVFKRQYYKFQRTIFGFKSRKKRSPQKKEKRKVNEKLTQ
jgi:hypothetical protein